MLMDCKLFGAGPVSPCVSVQRLAQRGPSVEQGVAPETLKSGQMSLFKHSKGVKNVTKQHSHISTERTLPAADKKASAILS